MSVLGRLGSVLGGWESVLGDWGSVLGGWECATGVGECVRELGECVCSYVGLCHTWAKFLPFLKTQYQNNMVIYIKHLWYEGFHQGRSFVWSSAGMRVLG